MKRRTFIAAVLIALSAAGQVVPFTFSDPQIYRLGIPPLPKCDAYDDMESYTIAANVNGLSAGPCWYGPYVDNYPYFGLGTGDDMESYTVSAALDGLNGGTTWYDFWGSAYVSANHDFYNGDDMESYTVTAALNGLNGGDTAQTPFWGGPYVDR